MARKFNLIFLLSLTLLSIFGTTSFAGIQITDEISDKILTYFENTTIFKSSSSVSDETVLNAQSQLKNLDRSYFTSAFNSSFDNRISSVYTGEYGIENLTIFGYYNHSQNAIQLTFILSNCTFSDDLAYLKFSAPLRDGNTGINLNTEGEGKCPAVNVKIQNNSITYFVGINISSTNFTLQNINQYINIEDEKIYISSLLGMGATQVIYFDDTNLNNGSKSYFIGDNIGEFPTTPIPTPTPTPGESGDTGGGGTITPSGDTGGGTTTPDYSEDLDKIQTGITDINNNISETNNKLDNISGEISNINNNLTNVPDISDTTITNDDITSNLDFEFEQDPYTNFWFELTTGLSNAFTNNKREISIQFRDKTHIISLDNFSIQIPSALKPFLTIISTVFITWKMLQYIKIIIDNISSGNIDEVLEMNEEEGITNLF